MRHFLPAVFGLAIAFLPLAAQAACVQSDLAGTWKFVAPEESEPAYCIVKLKSSGAVNASGSFCKLFNNTNNTSANANISGGKIRLQSNCSIKPGASNSKVVMAGVDQVFLFGQLSPGKDTVVAVIKSSDDKNVSTLIGVKQ